MLLHDDFATTVPSAVVDANDLLRRTLRAQGDDCRSARRVDFGFRRTRFFAAKAHALVARIEGLGLTRLPASQTTGAEGDVVMSIMASPYAVDFDLLDSMVTQIAADCGWRSEGWSAFVRETI